MLRPVTATRYVAPLREGGSLPGLVEADDLGTYVVKFRGAGHGRAALVAEVLAGELARALGLPVPEQVVVDLDPAIGRLEPDEEVQDLLRASAGANLGQDFLPGAVAYEPGTLAVDPALAASVLWFDLLVLNPDRTWRNPNALVWGRRLHLIDHGAALYVHHDWSREAALLGRELRGAEEHVLLPALRLAPQPAAALAVVDDALAPLVPAALDAVLPLVPQDWLEVPAARYRGFLLGRLAARASWLAPVLALLEGRARAC